MGQPIFSSRLAKVLIKSGYIVENIEPNRTNTERTIFYFKEDEDMKTIVNNYIMEQKDKKLLHENACCSL